MERSASASHSGSNPKFWVLTSKYFIIKSNLNDKRILIQIYFNNDLTYQEENIFLSANNVFLIQ